ncbi:nucleolar protein 9 [Lepisosteus oculatus]|uniref:nucleolar protein 9 n=1 Tax=Lepisosteus oculatus TaxID=7918 RepID=UPI003716C692
MEPARGAAAEKEGQSQRRKDRKGGKGKMRPEGRGGDGGKPERRWKRLDAMSVGYFRRVSARLEEEFSTEEERDMFVENVLSEVRGQAVSVATDITGSVALQKLLPLASPAQVGGVLTELGGDSGAQFKAVSCDRCGAHIVETALRQTHRLRVEDPEATTENRSEADGQADGEEDHGMLEKQVLALSCAVVDNLLEFAQDAHGTFVVRRLAETLGGRLTQGRPDRQTGRKPRDFSTQVIDFQVPPSFEEALDRLSDCLLDNINVFVTHSLACPVLQTVLTVSQKKRPELCQRLTEGIMGYLASLSAAPGTSPLLVFLKDQTSSRLLEMLIAACGKLLLRDLYRNHFRGHLVSLALHPIANFPVQRLTAAAAKHKLFLKIFDELSEGLEAILATGHMGVIVQLAESCSQQEERQAQCTQALLEAFHCWDPPSRRTSCAPLLLSLLAYEVYYHTDSPGGDTETSQRPLSEICYHGSLLVQSLLRFSDCSVVKTSLNSLPASDLLTLATDPSGSHVLEAHLRSLNKGKNKFLKKLQGHLVKIACSKHGSRFLESVWNNSQLKHKREIAQELVPSEAVLRADQFGRHVCRNFALPHFLKRRSQWEELQGAQSKKRKMFSDILEGV